MPNVHNKFIDPAGTYTGGYTSNELKPTPASHVSIQTRAVFQVDVVSGTVGLEMRVSPDANWVPIKTYSASAVEEIVLSNYMRVVATDSADCWLGEIS